jgi:3-hydroxymyristoyl/3-hydroxydecanoyl-(acyl carrier protein) dehydratase
LQARSVALRQAGELIQLQIAAAQQLLNHNAQTRESSFADRVPAQAAVISDIKSVSLPIHSPALPVPESKIRNPDVVWDEADLVEFAQGKIAPVFGEEYAIIDTYRRRVRLPTHPYLLVSRVTKVKGERGIYKPSSITTEYDIPHNAWYTVDGQIPWAVAVESGQCDLLLISYLGIDFDNKGERVYRLLDCTLTFLDDLPCEGETLRYDISIDSFARNGESLLFFFSYECFVGDNMFLKMTGGCAGFFSDKDLAQGKGIIITKKELEEKKKIPKSHFELPLACSKPAFDKTDLLYLSDGNLAGCFGEHYAQNGRNPSLRLHPPAIHMIDRVVSVDPTGGAWGLGLVIAEKDLEPEHWYFPCHFKDDQVLAGSLVAEGCEQLLQFYLLYLGLQTCTQDARFQPIPGLSQVVRTRRQITTVSSKLIYRMEITEIGLSPKPFAKANIDIIFEGMVVVDFKNLGLQLSEKNLAHALPAPSQEHAMAQPNVSQKQPLFDEYHITEFATGSVPNCFGPAYAIYENRRVPRTPNGDLQLISRILEVNGKQGEIKEFSSLVSEYDVPTDPWFYRQNTYPTLPYSIYMEMALQPCGFLSAYLGSTLPYPDVDFYFRNLDGHGRILKDIDVRGKTVVNRVRLLSSTAIQGVIIQKFDFQLVCEDVPFYQGEAVFGYFLPQALANQTGLDGGGETTPWYRQEQLPGLSNADLRTVTGRYQAGPSKPHYRLAHEQLDFLDGFLTIEGEGRYGQGYIYASKRVNPQDWFFSCHFYQDPVMPGSLGVEAILQAMQIYALEQDLGGHLNSPRFEQVLDHQIVWKYRGQITPDNKHMHLEVHISSIDTRDEQVIIIGDASLWKENLRIYEVKQVSIRLLEA